MVMSVVEINRYCLLCCRHFDVSGWLHEYCTRADRRVRQWTGEKMKPGFLRASRTRIFMESWHTVLPQYVLLFIQLKQKYGDAFIRGNNGLMYDFLTVVPLCNLSFYSSLHQHTTTAVEQPCELLV